KGTSDAEKTAYKKHIDELEKSVDEANDAASKMSKDFIPAAKAATQKASPATRDRFGAALVNLRQAVDDAGNANGAAAVRYPLALPGIVDSTKQMVPIFVADVVAEKTGKRPTLQGLQPGVTLEGGKVQLTLNGLSQAELGQLSIADVTGETIRRTQAWV